MSTQQPQQQQDVKWSSFWKVIALSLVVIAGLGLLIQQLNAGHHRPEGAAERWLAAVSDTGRKGVRADARDRAEEIGPVALAAALIPTEHNPKRGYFGDLEVGKAVENGVDAVRVPFQLHQHVDDELGPVKKGAIVLKRTGDEWHVTGVDGRRPGEEVPSEGGAPPSSAPLGLWIGAFVLGILLAGLTALIVRYTDRSAQRAMAASAPTG
jgi:hypothetical protein